MGEREYLTPAELVKRYKNTISERTLANWRSKGLGPTFVKIGGRVLYPVDLLVAWESRREYLRGRLYGILVFIFLDLALLWDRPVQDSLKVVLVN